MKTILINTEHGLFLVKTSEFSTVKADQIYRFESLAPASIALSVENANYIVPNSGLKIKQEADFGEAWLNTKFIIWAMPVEPLEQKKDDEAEPRSF